MSVSDNAAAEPAAEPKPVVGDDKPAANAADDKGPVPYERVSKLVGQKNDAITRAETAEAKLAQIAKEAKTISDAKLVQDGEAKTVITEQGELIESMTKDLEKYQTQDQSRRETLILEIPEASREIYKDLPLDKLEAHVKAVRGTATDASGMASSESASALAEAPGPKSRNNMTTKELIAQGAERRSEYLKKYGGVTVDQLKHPTRVTG